MHFHYIIVNYKKPNPPSIHHEGGNTILELLRQIKKRYTTLVLCVKPKVAKSPQIFDSGPLQLPVPARKLRQVVYNSLSLLR